MMDCNGCGRSRAERRVTRHYLSNCLIFALWALCCRGYTLHTMRNRWGRAHFYAMKNGRAFHFSRPGVGRRRYCRNLIYRGYVSRWYAQDARLFRA